MGKMGFQGGKGQAAALNCQTKVGMITVMGRGAKAGITTIWLAETYGVGYLIMVSLEKKYMGSLLNSYLFWISRIIPGLVNRNVTWITRVRGPSLNSQRWASSRTHWRVCETSWMKGRLCPLQKILFFIFSPDFPQAPMVILLEEREKNQTFGGLLYTGSELTLTPALWKAVSLLLVLWFVE